MHVQRLRRRNVVVAPDLTDGHDRVTHALEFRWVTLDGECRRPRGSSQKLGVPLARQALPERLGDKRHDRLQQSQRLIEGIHEHRAGRFAVVAFVVA